MSQSHPAPIKPSPPGSARTALTALATVLLAPVASADTALSATAEPDSALKVINFTADWCPNCQVLNPRLDDAIARFEEGDVALVNLDLTGSQASDEATRQETFRTALAAADAHKVSYLWDWYGGITGLAVVVSADNGEPITCANRELSSDQIEERLREALVLALRAPAGTRKPNGPDCPPPLR